MTSEATVMTNSVSRGIAVLASAEPDDDVAQRPVADVEDAWPEDPVRVDAERVLVVEAVVEERAGQVVRGADRVDVARQVEVEILHRDDLAVAAAGRAALDPEHRPERRLADADRGPVADALRPWASPTVVVDLPSPSGVGEIAVTSTYLPRGRSPSSRAIAASVTLAFVGPYSSSSSSGCPGRGRPRRSAAA